MGGDLRTVDIAKIRISAEQAPDYGGGPEERPSTIFKGTGPHLRRQREDHPVPTSRAEREADLRTYYDNEARDRSTNTLPAERVEHRDAFIGQLRKEGRSSVVEVGTGPGRDSVAFTDAGIAFRGIDLAPASVALCTESGLDVSVGSVLELPFSTGEFDAAYTASTLLHIADDDLDTAIAELVRVVRPGSPVAIGLWGAPQSREQRWGDPAYGPARFFALRSDDDLRATLARHGTVETFKTWEGDTDTDLHYQWAIVRTRPRHDPSSLPDRPGK